MPEPEKYIVVGPATKVLHGERLEYERGLPVRASQYMLEGKAYEIDEAEAYPHLLPEGLTL